MYSFAELYSVGLKRECQHQQCETVYELNQEQGEARILLGMLMRLLLHKVQIHPVLQRCSTLVYCSSRGS